MHPGLIWVLGMELPQSVQERERLDPFGGSFPASATTWVTQFAHWCVVPGRKWRPCQDLAHRTTLEFEADVGWTKNLAEVQDTLPNAMTQSVITERIGRVFIVMMFSINSKDPVQDGDTDEGRERGWQFAERREVVAEGDFWGETRRRSGFFHQSPESQMRS